MAQVPVFYGEWVMKDFKWYFEVDNHKGGTMFFLNDASTHRELVEMAKEDYNIEKNVDLVLTYTLLDSMLNQMDPNSPTPPMCVSNEVTAILVLYGLPRLLTGSILAHEMMHAWLRLNGYPNLRPEFEEGICQVLAHMWLDSETYAGSTLIDIASSSSSSSAVVNESSKKGERSEFEKKLGEFFKHQIEADPSSAYGDGLRQGNNAVLMHGLRRTLEHIRLTGTFP